jgi:hypothetical protein
VRAAERAGLEVARVEIDTSEGPIMLTMVSQPGTPTATLSDRRDGNEWDGVLQ